MRVALLDYGAGNLHSLGKALERGGATVSVTSDWDVALAADALVLPGVGAFSSAVAALPEDRARVRDALQSGFPCLGICLGMQLFFGRSDEGEGEGIGLIPGRVRQLDAPVVPHMGWNDVEEVGDPLFEGLDGGLAAYFAHSYRCDPVDSDTVVGWTEYAGDRMAAAVRWQRSWGVQFHPEKSSVSGLKLVSNFLAMARQ